LRPSIGPFYSLESIDRWVQTPKMTYFDPFRGSKWPILGGIGQIQSKSGSSSGDPYDGYGRLNTQIPGSEGFGGPLRRHVRFGGGLLMSLPQTTYLEGKSQQEIWVLRVIPL